MIRRKEELHAVAKDMFNKYDADNSGEIDFQEFAHLMIDIAKTFNLPEPSGREIDQAMKHIDINSDGVLSFEELEPMLMDVIS